MSELTEGGITTFLNTDEWKFFAGETKNRLDSILKELETGIALVEGNPVVLDYAGLSLRQGECRSLRWILNMPVILIDINKEKLKGEQ